jgi:hypothetical protein
MLPRASKKSEAAFLLLVEKCSFSGQAKEAVRIEILCGY